MEGTNVVRQCSSDEEWEAELQQTDLWSNLRYSWAEFRAAEHCYSDQEAQQYVFFLRWIDARAKARSSKRGVAREMHAVTCS